MKKVLLLLLTIFLISPLVYASQRVNGDLYVTDDIGVADDATIGNVLTVLGDWSLGTTLTESGDTAYYHGVEIGTGGGSSTPGGSDTQVQYNDGGSFAGDSNLTVSGGVTYYKGVELNSGSSGTVSSVNGETGVVVLTQDDIGDGSTYKQYSDTEKTKLSGIEDSADVTDTTNVTAAGALMDSEVDADIKTLVLPASTTISTYGATLVDDADAATARTTLDVDQAGTDNSTNVTLAGTPDYITITGQVITRGQIDLTADVVNELPASSVSVLELGTATYDDVQDWINTTQSAGKLTGGAFTDNGDGTLSVAAGTGFIKTTDSDVAVNKFFDWVIDSSVALTDNSANYLYIDYNAGSPQIAVTTTIPTDHNTKILLGEVFREGTTLHFVSAGQVMSNLGKRVFWKNIDVYGKFQRSSGIIISETGTRNIAVTAGYIYAGLTKASVDAIDTSVSDVFTYYYRDGSGGWTKVTSQTQIDNTQYDDGSGTLATLSSGGWGGSDKYGVHWVYKDVDSDSFVVYGQGNYNLQEAQDAQPPSSIPDLLKEVSGLIGKIIIQKDDSTFTSIQSAFDVTFSPTGIVDHNDLANIQGGTADEYYHLTEAEHTDILYGSDLNTFSELQTLVADKTLVNEEDAVAWDSTHSFAGQVTINNDLVVGGDLSLDGNLTARGDNAMFICVDNNLDAVVIDASGNVGINTVTPAAQLDVIGNTNIGGDLTVTGVSFLNNIGASSSRLFSVVDIGTGTIILQIDGGGSAITTGIVADIQVPYACTIESATILADQSGSIVIDVWKDTYANYPPTDADSIAASAVPTLSSATKSTDTTLTGWTTSIASGDTLRFNVDSASTVTRVVLILKVKK